MMLFNERDAMSAKVIRPPQFQKGGPQNPLVSLSHESALAIYTGLLNMYMGTNTGIAAQQRVAVLMTQKPWGMSGEDTLAAASVISNNSLLLEKLQDCLKNMMNLLMAESCGSFPGFERPQSDPEQPPHEPPPAA